MILNINGAAEWQTYIDQISVVKVVLVLREEGVEVGALAARIKVEVETCVVVKRLRPVLRQREEVICIVASRRAIARLLQNLSGFGRRYTLDLLAHLVCRVLVQLRRCLLLVSWHGLLGRSAIALGLVASCGTGDKKVSYVSH